MRRTRTHLQWSYPALREWFCLYNGFPEFHGYSAYPYRHHKAHKHQVRKCISTLITPSPLTGFATSTFDIKAEATWLITARTGFLSSGQQISRIACNRYRCKSLDLNAVYDQSDDWSISITLSMYCSRPVNGLAKGARFIQSCAV